MRVFKFNSINSLAGYPNFPNQIAAQIRFRRFIYIAETVQFSIFVSFWELVILPSEVSPQYLRPSKPQILTYRKKNSILMKVISGNCELELGFALWGVW